MKKTKSKLSIASDVIIDAVNIAKVGIRRRVIELYPNARNVLIGSLVDYSLTQILSQYDNGEMSDKANELARTIDIAIVLTTDGVAMVTMGGLLIA